MKLVLAKVVAHAVCFSRSLSLALRAMILRDHATMSCWMSPCGRESVEIDAILQADLWHLGLQCLHNGYPFGAEEVRSLHAAELRLIRMGPQFKCILICHI